MSAYTLLARRVAVATTRLPCNSSAIRITTSHRLASAAKTSARARSFTTIAVAGQKRHDFSPQLLADRKRFTVTQWLAVGPLTVLVLAAREEPTRSARRPARLTLEDITARSQQRRRRRPAAGLAHLRAHPE